MPNGAPRSASTMTRVFQGISLWVAMLALVAAVLLIANFDAETESCELAPSLATVGCFIRTYKELAAGLLGAAGAIFAAWIAWLAVQGQIRSEELRATAEARETLDAIRARLGQEYVSVLNEFWRAVDLAMTKTDDEALRNNRQRTAFEAAQLLAPAKELDAIAELSRVIAPGPRLKLFAVLDAYRYLYQDEQDSREKGGEALFYLFHLQFMMSRFATVLHEFDPAMAAVFDNRTKVDAEITPRAEAIRQMIASCESGESGE